MELKKGNNKKRIIVMGVVCIIFLVGIIVRIGYLQFVQAAWLQERAYKQQTINKIISPKRGTIYDSTKEKKLAISATVDTISVNPKLIKEDNKEKVAKAMADIFSLEYETVLEKVNKTTAVETIVKKVEKEKGDELRAWMSDNKIASGINIDEDTKRYYPYANLASHVIGFCGDDNQGLEGLEAELDDILRGNVGKLVASKSATGEELPSGTENYIPSENGSDVVLTIDANIQSIAEKYLKQAVIENECTNGGNVIIMNPKNGDILAMATYPDYNLNTPFEISDELSAYFEGLDATAKKNKLFEIIRNRAIADTYEPGSTFKLITAAIALEEGLVTTDKTGDFSCTGSTVVVPGERSISCLRGIVHGSQTLRDALNRSCNSAFIQLGQRIGIPTFYNYLNGFGFFNEPGISLPGDVKGIFVDEDKMRKMELATLSFGQRFNITPLQLITAVSAIVNDGKMMQPRIVKEIIDTENDITTEVNPTFVRQVISKETSEKMRDLMESVVVDGSAKHAQVTGYTVGGKTGTSEDGVNTNRYIASFIGVSPISSPEVAILVTLYDPKGDSGYQGGGIAAPLVGQILGEVLPYLQSGRIEEGSEETKTTVTVPEVRTKTISNAIKDLEALGFKVVNNVKGDKDTLVVTDQVPKPGVSLGSGSIVVLYTEENEARIMTKVPKLKGMTAAQAVNSLKSKNLNISIEGDGIVISQDPMEDTDVEEGSVIKVKLSKDTVDV